MTNAEIRSFWIFYWLLMIRWFLLSLIGILSGGVIIAFILKHVFKVKYQFWWLNDTKDGDYGAEWWLKEKGYKKGLWSAFNWWFRNHSWNFIRQFNPPWYGGQTEDFKVVKNTLSKPGKWRRADKENPGINYIAYRIDGKVFCQYSRASKSRLIQIGAGGSEYRFRAKL